MPKLLAHPAAHPQKILVHLPRPAAKALDHSKHLLARLDWETKSAVQPAFRSRCCAREIAFPRHIMTPDRLASLPYAPGKTRPAREADFAAGRLEIADLNRPHPPDSRVVDFIRQSIHLPKRARLPSSHLEKSLEYLRCRFHNRIRFRQRPAHRLLNLEPLFGSIPLGDQRSQHQRRHRNRAHECLRVEQRLIGIRRHEWTQLMKRAPHRKARYNESKRRCPAFTKAECRPQQRWNG